MSQNPFAGTWTYRSFRNDPTRPYGDEAKLYDYAKLYFGSGELVIYDTAIGQIEGQLTLRSDYAFKLQGYCTLGNPFTIRFQGVGNAPESMGQKYDYLGYLSPRWPNGMEQLPAILGTIVRTLRPDNPKLEGYVASWIAVKWD